MGKKGTKACKAIAENTGITRYRGNKRDPKTDLLVNYGLAGPKKDRFYQIYPSAKTIPTLNKNVGHSKFYAVKRAEKHGIRIPETRISLRKADAPKKWLEKRIHSIGGKGIRRARGRLRIKGKYYQKNVTSRVYELRIHAFAWMDRWVVQKRLGQRDEIAWNFSNGGHFQTVHNPMSSKACSEAVEISERILKIFNMSFGAVDFIVDSKQRVYFIEINSAPGFSGLSDHIYFEAFNALKKMSKRKVLVMA
ncbi:hypothetical protein DRO91_07990 [Candidatus Heimdallarchaeota archaeon]|nr:MAG: hypothetical protein DRO91_07990 [Candidatus Heimdallarchaeota archaeon]